jgi:hypothetical protein
VSALRYWDPAGTRFGIPTYPWRMAPDGLATRRQLAAAGLSPRGDVVAQLRWRHRAGRGWAERFANLYAEADAVPKRPVTPGVAAALGKAMAARRWCPGCGRDVGYCISRRHGLCGSCVAASEQVA